MKKLLALFLFTSPITFGQGLIIDKSDSREIQIWEPEGAQGYASILPSKISYRKYAPIPGYQGKVSTCTGWAVAYGMLTTQQNLLMQISQPVIRTARAMDPHFIYSLIKDYDDKWCQKGTMIYDAMDVLMKHGCKPQFQVPALTCNSTLSVEDYTLAIAQPYKINMFYGLTMDADAVVAVKEALNGKHIVAVGMSLTNSFMTGSSVNNGLWAPNSKEKLIGAHAMCVVGYDDSKYGGSFEIMNSYSTAYGDGGFIWVKYSDFEKYMNQAFIIDIEGFQADGCMNGDCTNFGIYKSESGDMYEGYLDNGYPDGVGTHYFSDGSFYVGEFKSGRKNGYGLFYDVTDATYYSVSFSYDELVASSSLQGFSSEESSEKPEIYYKHLSQFVNGKLVTDEEKVMEKLGDLLVVPNQPFILLKKNK